VIAHLSIFILVLYLSEFKAYCGRLGGSRAGASVIVASCCGGGSDGVWWTSKVGARVVAVDDSGGNGLCRIISCPVFGNAVITTQMLVPRNTTVDI
jgi:hypothetical protein